MQTGWRGNSFIHLTQLLNCQEYDGVGKNVSEDYLAPVVHEALEILEEQVLVFVQKALDGISVIDVEESDSNGVIGWKTEITEEHFELKCRVRRREIKEAKITKHDTVYTASVCKLWGHYYYPLFGL